MWAIVDMQWTGFVAKWIGSRKCLEVMAGAGWLAKALNDHGVIIKATDDHSWDIKHKNIKRVFPVENIEAIKAIEKFPDSEVLIISWPPYNEPEAYETIKIWGNDRPIVYIGEWDGCTADKQFHNHFREDKRYAFSIPSFPNLHDHIYIGYYHNDN